MLRTQFIVTMKIVVTTLLFLVPITFSGFAQEETPGFFRIGIKASPDITFRTLYSDNPQVDYVKDMRDDTELPRFGYTTGLSFGFQLGPHIELETGAFYSARGYKMEKLSITTTENPEPVESVQLFYSYQYLDIPLTVNAFFFNGKKLQLVASASFTTNMLLHGQESFRRTTDGNQQTTHLPQQANYKPFAFSAEAGVGICWEMSDRLQLRAMPTFRYGLTKMNDNPITARLWSGGLAVGCYYLF